MNYENNPCPVCGRIITPEDDIVVCPDCGTPHHRACWQALGQCVYTERHGDFTWQPTFSAGGETSAEQAGAADAAQVCPRCGQPCAPDALTCPRCGKTLSARSDSSFAFNTDAFLRGVDMPPETDLGGITVRDAAMLVQYRVPSYMRKFTRTQSVGWNWAAFLFSPFWFFYRKIYKLGALFLGITMVCSVFLMIPVSRMQTAAMQVVEQYVTIDENSSPEQIMADLAALGGEEQAQVQSALMRYSQSMLLFLAGLMVPNIFAALAADSAYKKKLIRDAESLHDFAENERTYRMLALRRGGVSVLSLAACYLTLSLFMNIVFSLVQF